jgi:4-amino-4-deoxy-L-arabinose transferase-like glycosyltransferase
VDISTDGQTWQALADAKRQSPFIWSWSVIKIRPPSGGPLSGRFLRWTVLTPGEMIFEIAVTESRWPGIVLPMPGGGAPGPVPTGPDGRPWPGMPLTGLRLVQPDPGDPVLADPARAGLLDEPGSFIYYPDPEHDMVFDEVYHARTAWEHLRHLEPYEWTHPPLGKLIIALGIGALGMDPLGWRLPGVIFGILMLPLIYLTARRLFGDPLWALAAQVLLAVDFMHFTQSRIGTVDVFMVFFLIAMLYAFWRWYAAVQGEPRVPGTAKAPGRLPAPAAGLNAWLLLAGLCLGLAGATKWNALYPVPALALLYFAALAGRVRRSGAGSWLALSLGTALVAFLALPLAIYYCSYIPYFLVPGHQGGLAEVLDWQQRMFAYHRDLNVAHDFASPWWQWPLLVKPVWYYTARDTMPAGLTATVAAFGNPAVWWLSLPAVLAGAWRAIRRRDPVLVFLVAVFLSMYVPWMVAPRKVTFIYHFFPMVPVVILIIVRLMQGFRADALGSPGQGQALREARALNRIYALYLGLAVLVFAAFYPVLSGATVSLSWVRFLHWLPGWFF